MGAGKTTIGAEVAHLVNRPFVDADEEIVRRHGSISDLFRDGEPGFRRIEEVVVGDLLAAAEPAILALGGGALGSPTTRELLRRRAFVVFVDVDVEEAWARARGSDRPLAQTEAEFRRLYEQRQRVYREAANAVARDADDVLLASWAISVERGALGRLASALPSDRSAALIADEHVLALHAPALDAPVHAIPAGEAAKTLAVVERLWNEIDLDRQGVIVAFGGGATTDVAGFVAATYLRMVPWIAVPTTLVGQVDAAIGGKTGIDLAKGKNLVGAFHWPLCVVSDPDVLATLSPRERRNGMAEAVKTALLAGKPLWELEEEDMIRACAAFKAAVCLSDPLEQTGRRSILNLGHTFAHALEAASDYAVPHGEAVALGLLAALRLSGQPTDAVEEVLSPDPVPVDRDRAWAAMQRDKKARNGRIRLVLLEGFGKPVFPVELPDEQVRRELDRLITK